MTPNTSLDWADFRPSRLEAARRQVVETHPSKGDKLRAASRSELQTLKERLARAEGDRGRLEKFAHELKASELRGLAVQIGHWEKLRESIAVVLRERPRSSVLPHLWSTWQRFPLEPVIRSVLRDLADEHGWLAVASGYESAAESWTGSERPGVAIQQWLDEQGLSYSDLPDLADLPLDLDAQLARNVRRAVMTEGSAAQLRTEGADRLIGWFHQLQTGDGGFESDNRKRFGRHYLVTLEVRHWEPEVLELIRERYGPPKDRAESREAFWDHVPEQERSAFHRWFIERNLEEALGSDTDRHRYWVGKSDELVDVELGKAGRVEYAVLYFDTFGVIEFFEVGNAAYFYPLDRLSEVHTDDAMHPAALKDKYRPRFGPATDNRLIHRERWQRKADRMVETWKAGTAR